MELQVNDLLWHPMSMDIIPHKVVSKTEYEDRTVYVSRALGNVGACGRVEVELSVDRKGKIRFIGLANDYESDSGLQDFVEGEYFRTKNEARTEYYKIQKSITQANMGHKERLYKEAKKSYDTCCRILDELKKEREEEK